MRTTPAKSVTRRRPSRHAAPLRKGAPASEGFTLVELLVVVAMIALITLGLARIFKSTGDTVRAGKRVSNVNTYATLIERQMRKDFESITRSGFLVIRNSYTGVPNNPNTGIPPTYAIDNDVRLTPNDANPRRRRVDQILFFANGDFVSQRNPVHPDRIARSSEAMIYYGHGLKRDPAHGDFRDLIEIDDDNADATITPGFSRPAPGGRRGPNQFAADWVLARRAFLLQAPNVIGFDPLPNNLIEPNRVWPGPPSNPFDGGADYEDPDRNIQIALQPAAISPFRTIAGDNRNSLPTNTRIVRDENPVRRPNLASGVVDIISCSLGEVADILIDAQPVNNVQVPFWLGDDTRTAGDPLGDGGVFGAIFQPDAPNAVNAPNSVTRTMQEWMRQAFPANSDAGHRVRLETSTPDWSGSISSPGGGSYDRDYKRTDQEMLLSSNFVPHCTEFIVEYSFGNVYPPTHNPAALRGKMIWHGLERTADLDANGSIDMNTETVAAPYGNSAIDLYAFPFRGTDGTTFFKVAQPRLICTGTNNFGGSNQPEYAYFGILDPSYRVPSDGVFGGGQAFDDVNGNGVRDTNPPLPQVPEGLLGNGDAFYDPGIAGERRLPGAPDTIPWPWPKLIRITMNIIDPLDPLNEQTLQFTFELPTEPEGRQF